MTIIKMSFLIENILKNEKNEKSIISNNYNSKNEKNEHISKQMRTSSPTSRRHKPQG